MIDWSRFFSRKFVVTQQVLILTPAFALMCKKFEISDSVAMMVIGVFAASQAAYSVVNYKDAKNVHPESEASKH